MYEEENNIETYKVSGKTINDMVDNMVDIDYSLMTKLPKEWVPGLNVDQEIYIAFYNILNQNIKGRYKDIIKAAFIAVTRLPTYSEKEYFHLLMKCHLSNGKDIFDRYRAYFKLIFI